MKEIELIDKRKLNEKHFLQPDGTIIARVYSDNVHYLKNGKYEDIDNTLIKKKESLVTEKNDYHVSFQEQGKKSIMHIEKGDSYIDIKLKDANDTLAKVLPNTSNYVNNVEYNNILDGIDLEYKTLPSKVKETIILNTVPMQNIVFTINTNLELLEDKGKIIASSIDGQIFAFEKPYMEDSNGVINTNIGYKIKKLKNNYELELLLDEEWLKLPTTSYPVLIDPTITTDSENLNVYDTYIYPGDTNVDKNSQPYLKAGVERINNQDIVNRTLIKFDLPELGTGSEVIGANLWLVGYPTNLPQINNEKTVTIHQITQNWDETTADWVTMNDKFLSKVESIQCISRSIIENNEIYPSRSPYTDITNLVKKWYGDTPNYGLMIKSATEQYIDDNIPAFFSKNNNVSGNYDPKPLLEITYRNQNGIESYLDYKEQTFTDGATYVNTYNGNLVGVFDLLTTKSKMLPTSIKLIYNTNDVIIKNNGFKFSVVETIKETTIDSINYLEYEDPDGTIHYFYPNENNNSVYYDEDGLELKVTKQNNTCIMVDKYDNSKTFTKNSNNIYYLTKIQDNIGNQVINTYDNLNRISQIVDADSNVVTFTYNQSSIIVSDSNNSITLSTNGNKIESIQNLNGTTYFEYVLCDTFYLISKITDINGKKMGYEYCSQKPFKVKKITEYGLNNTVGKYYSFEYGFNSTTITDNRQRINTLMFNSIGNLLSVNGMPSNSDIESAYSVAGTYGTDFQNKNRVKSNTMIVKYVKNLMNNSSFEVSSQKYFVESTNMNWEYSTDDSVSGTHSLKLSSQVANEYITFNTSSLNINLESDNSYTFSGYFKSAVALKLKLKYTNSENVLVSKTLDILPSTEFIRQDISIDYEPSVNNQGLVIEIIQDAAGITYIDDIQLEKGDVVNNYNPVENSDFSDGLTGWNLEAYAYPYNPIDDPTPVPVSEVFETTTFNNNTNSALKVKMNPLHYSRASKTIPINGKSGDIYTISFWYKNEGILGDGGYVGNEVSIYFKPVEHDADYCILPSEEFYPNEEWQYFSFRYSADEDFESIKIYFLQGRQANNLYITNITLNKDLNITDYNYDEYGNIISVTDSANKTSLFNYDGNNQIISSTSPKGKRYRFEYDNDNPERVLSVISDKGISNKLKYDSYGNVVSSRISNVFDSAVNDGLYRIRSKGTNSYLQDKDNKLEMENEPCNITVWRIYKNQYRDVPGYRITSAVKGLSIFYNNSENTISLGSGFTDLLYFESRTNGTFYIHVYDFEYGEKYLKVNNNGEFEFTVGYDSEDPSYEFYFELANKQFMLTEATYSNDGKYLTSVTDSNLNRTEYSTDPITGLLTSITDANGVSTNYEYNNKKQNTKITKDNRKIEYQYNAQNQIDKIKFNSEEYNLTYDDFLNIESFKIGNSLTLYTNTFLSNNGKLSSTEYGNNQSIDFEYDYFDRLSKLTLADDTYEYKYNNNGDLAKILSNNHTYKYDYDIIGRIKQHVYDNFRVVYDYDANNNITSKKYQLDNTNTHIISNVFDNQDNILSTTIDNDTISYEYDDLGRLSSETLNSNYSKSYEYVTNGNRTSELVKSVNIDNTKYTYKYDNLNNITHIFKNNILNKQYYYDSLQEIIRADDYEEGIKEEYVYDNNGNILSKTRKNLLTDQVVSSDSFEYTNSLWVDQMTKFNNQSITYDGLGNPISIGNNVSMSWINGRRLNSYSDTSNNLTVTYKYNPDGIRTSKTINNIQTDYYLENSNIIYEKTGNNIIHYLYDNDEIIGLKYNNNTYYYVKNLQNDIIGILDSNYNQIVTYKYDIWGKLLHVLDSNNAEITDPTNIGLINPFRYRSYYYDTETKLYYLNSRYYNPEWCRFISIDVTLGSNADIISHNLYSYVSNNPVMVSDILGEGLFKSIGKAIKKGVKAVSKTVKKVGKAVGKAVSKAVDIGVKVLNATLGSIISVEVTHSTTQSVKNGNGLANVEVGNTTTVTTARVGSKNSLIKLKVNVNDDNPLDSTVGVATNGIITSEISLGLTVQELEVGVKTGETTSTALRLGCSGTDAYFGVAETKEIDDNISITNFAQVNVNKIVIVAVVVAPEIVGALEATGGVGLLPLLASGV